jgi:phage-related baseplate assembly protein
LQQEHKVAAIDLSQLPPPKIVKVPDFETLLAERKASFVALYPVDQQDAVRRTLALESEPITKQLQENTYREILLLQRINEAALAVMVAYSGNTDLDQLAANYNVKRLIVTPADDNAVPPVPAVYESDEELRPRIPGAFEGLSVAGPTAAYEFHAKSADGRVADASATSPAPAEVVLTVLSREGDGTAGADLLAVVDKALNSESVRPVADRLTVRSAEIIPYTVDATIFIYPGPEAEPVMAEAKASLQKYIASQTRLGRDIRLSAIYAALHVEGVQRVELASPQGDVVLDKTQAASCTAWSVTNGGTDE